MTVWVITAIHEYGATSFTGTTEESVKRQLDNWCRCQGRYSNAEEYYNIHLDEWATGPEETTLDEGI